MNANENANPREGMMTAIIDARRLALRCLQLEKDLKDGEERAAEREKTLAQWSGKNQELASLAEIGRRELSRRKEETLSRLRAIVHYAGGAERLRALERLFADETASAEEIERLGKIVMEEFQALYPNRAASVAAEAAEFDEPRSSNMSAFRLRPA
ncbi:MAG: hypothetical protein AB1656_01190 [Candidatus Omnitrophota bacterium]